MKKYFAAGLLILGVLVGSLQAQSDRPKNEIEARGTWGVPTGDANFSGTTSSNQTVDFSRDFDFDGKLGYDIRYTYRSENQKHKFTVEYGRDNWTRKEP